MEMNTQGINKPIMILREEFMMNMSNLINKSGLPLFIIEPIMRDMLMEVNAGVKRQYEMEKVQYEQALMAAAKAEGEQDDRRKIPEEITEAPIQE